MKHGSRVRQRFSIHCSPNERGRIVIVNAGWRRKSHSLSPLHRSLGVNSCDNHPPLPIRAFYDCGRPVGILANDSTPAAKLWAMFPILISHWFSYNSGGYGCLVYSLFFGGVEAKPNARG